MSRQPARGTKSPEIYPFFSDAQLYRRERDHPNLCISDSVSGLPLNVRQYLEDSESADLLDGLRLRPLDRAVVELKLAGASIRDIMRVSGVKKWRIEQSLRRVRIRVDSLHKSGALRRRASGWEEVYKQETRRRGCGRPD